MKLHHIGIAVTELETACRTYSKILGEEFSPVEIVDSQKVKVCFAGGIELIEATQAQSPLHPMMKHPILSFIEKNGEGIHHLCFEVKDLDATITTLRENGIDTLSEKPQTGSNDSRIIFLNPKSCHNLLIELREITNG